MPTYTYRCKECGHQFDARQKFSDDPLTDCPTCDGRLRRLVNNSGGIVFKGSGFYVNDSKSSNKSTKSSASTSRNTPNDNGNSGEKEAQSSSSTSDAEKQASSNDKKEKSSVSS